MVKLYVSPRETKIFGLDPYYEDMLNDLLSFRPGGYFFTDAFQNKTWDGYIRLLKKRDDILYTYTGLVKRILMFLKKQDLEYEIIKTYSHDGIKFEDIPLKEIVLRDYQQEAIEICKKKKRGIIKLPTGSGKTIIFIKLVIDFGRKCIIVVNRNSLLEQLLSDFEEKTGLRESEINFIGGGRKQYNKNNFITAATFQSLLSGKFDNIINETEMIILDETHHLSMNELGEIVKKARNAFYIFGFSATNFRTDGYDMMLEAHVGPTIYSKSISDLIAKGYLARPNIYFIKCPNNSDKRLSYAALYNLLVKNNYRNQLIAKSAYEFAKRGRTVLISILRLNHIKTILDELKKIDDIGFNIKVITGKDSAHEKITTIKKMDKNEYDIVIATLFGEGVNVPSLSVLINCRAAKSEIDAIQQCGRILRPKKNGEIPAVIDFFDYNEDKTDGKIDYFKRFAKKRKKIYESEPEFNVKIVENVEDIFKDIQ